MTEPPGPGLDPDSMSYLGAAESLVQRGTLRIPAAGWKDTDSTTALGHFPPGFPLAIAAAVALGAPPVQAARGVEAAAAFATVVLAVSLVGAVAGTAAGAVAGVLLLVTPSFAFDHWQVVSEPLCLALLMATLALMSSGRRPWTYGLTAAAAGMVRYAAFSATGAVALWAFGLRGSPRERARRAVAAVVPSVLLQGLWVLRSLRESAEVRSFGLRGGLAASFRELAGTLGAWLAPAVAAPWLGAVLAVAVGGAAGFAVVRAARPPALEPREPEAPIRRLLAAAGALAGCYAGLVLFSRMFVDLTIPVDQRILSPFIVLAETAAVAAFASRWQRRRRGWRAALAAAGVVWLGASALATARAIADALDGGWGYASDETRASRIGAWLRGAGAGAELFSDDPAGVWFLTGRPSRDAPETLDADSLAAFGRVLRERHGVLVGFPSALEIGAPPDSLAARLGLAEVARFPDGVAWGVPRAPAAAGTPGS